MENLFIRTEVNKVYDSYKYLETENTDLRQHYITWCEQHGLLNCQKRDREFMLNFSVISLLMLL